MWRAPEPKDLWSFFFNDPYTCFWSELILLHLFIRSMERDVLMVSEQ